MPLACFSKCFSRAKRIEINNLRNKVFGESSDVEKRDEKYLTALHLAARHGQVDCVEELLKKGANPNRYFELLIFKVEVFLDDFIFLRPQGCLSMN